MNRNRVLTGAAIVVVLVVLGYAGYQNYLAPIPAIPTVNVPSEDSQSGPTLISVEGRVVPAQFVRLSFNSGGLLAEVFVSEGDEVVSGQLLARLENYSQYEAGVAAAKLHLVGAQQAYDGLFNGLDLSRALGLKAVADGRDAVRDAEQRLKNIESFADQTDIAKAEADLEVANALLAEAERVYEEMDEGPSPDALELAEAGLENANAQLAAAQDALDQQELRAPFAGTLVSVELKAGEFAVPGLPVVVLADLSAWRIETSDLSENDVILLEAGQLASISLDAFPGQTFSGEVLEIGLMGVDSRGSVAYTVLLSFDAGGVPVRWGMVAFVDIEVD